MTDSPVTKTAEQVAADALNDLWPNETVNGADWIAESHEAVTIAGSFRKAGLLASDVPSGAAFFEAAKAERATHEGRGWTAEHDRKQGAAHPLRLALDYLANGKSVKAGALVYAALDLLASGAPSEEQIERAAVAYYESMWPNADRTLETESAKERLREAMRAALTAAGVTPTAPVDREKLAAALREANRNPEGEKWLNQDQREAAESAAWPGYLKMADAALAALAGVGSPVPVQVDEAKAEALEEAAAQIPFPADP